MKKITEKTKLGIAGIVCILLASYLLAISITINPGSTMTDRSGEIKFYIALIDAKIWLFFPYIICILVLGHLALILKELKGVKFEHFLILTLASLIIFFLTNIIRINL